MQIASARHRFASHVAQLPPESAAKAARESSADAATSPAASSSARAAYSHVTARLAQRLQADLPEDASAQPRSLFRNALERIRNTLLGA